MHSACSLSSSMHLFSCSTLPSHALCLFIVVLNAHVVLLHPPFPRTAPVQVVLDASLDIASLADRFKRKAAVAAVLAEVHAEREARAAAARKAREEAAERGGDFDDADEGAGGFGGVDAEEGDAEPMEQPITLATFRELLDMLKSQVRAATLATVIFVGQVALDACQDIRPVFVCLTF